jgi:hypothetical protein
MGKPTEQELEQALAEAIRMRESRDDPHSIAKTLLNLNYRHALLMRVLQAAEVYLKFGQEEQEHRNLLQVIEDAKQAEAGEGSGNALGELGL